MQPGWGDVAHCISERDKKCATAESTVVVVVKLQMEQFAPASALAIFGELMETLDIVPRKWQMLQGTSRQLHSHMRLNSRKPQ